MYSFAPVCVCMTTSDVSSNSVFGNVSRVVPDNFRLGIGSVTVTLVTMAVTVAVAMATQHAQLNDVEKESGD